MPAPDYEKPRLLREALLNEDMSPRILTDFAMGIEKALLGLPSVQILLEQVWQEEQALAAELRDDENPFAHESSPNGCADGCPACAWDNRQITESCHRKEPSMSTRGVSAGVQGDGGAGAMRAAQGAQMHTSYSVLLLYPGTGDRPETYYTHTTAEDPHAALANAQADAHAVNPTIKAGDFLPLLVVRGHIEAELLFSDLAL